MNIRDLLGPSLLALGTILLFRAFWGGFAPQGSDASFTAPLSRVEQQPLFLEIDFKDNEKSNDVESISVSTEYANFTFSSGGATLSELTFVRSLNNVQQTFTTIGIPQPITREAESFIVALDEKTPYMYRFKGREEDEETVYIRFEAYADSGMIEKEFVIYKHLYKMDLTLTVSPVRGRSMRPRIVWPAPFLKAIEGEESIASVVFDKTGKYTKKSENSLNLREGYFSPQIFGSEDKYFIHAMVEDPNKFSYRAYYNVVGRTVISYIESQEVTEKTTWTLRFFLGPKEGHAINSVAPALEKTFNYGFFSPLAKVILYFLNLCNRYVHNFGIAIILITLLLKLLLLPFTFKGDQKLKKMQAYSQKLTYLQQKYRHDPEALKQAQMELIQTHGMPGVGGCLPLFLPLPFFAGLYGALNNSIDLYRAPFILWIRDLSVPDPYYVLSILIGVSVLASAATAGKKGDIKQYMGAAVIALLLAAWTSSMAAGLSLFIFANALLHALQQMAQRRLGL